MQRKNIYLTLILLILLSFTACGTKENQEVTPNNTNQSKETSSTSSTKTTAEQTNKETEVTKPQETTTSHKHNYADATCIIAKTCSCGATIGEPLGHQLSPATCTSPAICTRCGISSGSSLGHNYLNATCTTPQTCSVCGSTSGEPLGHNYSNATCTVSQTCTVCGSTYGSPLGHNYINYVCSRCNMTDPDSKVALYDLKVYDYQGQCCTDYEDYDTLGNQYFNVIRMGNKMQAYYEEVPEITEIIYNTNYNYTKFKGTLSYWDSTKDGHTILWDEGSLTFSVYADNELIYSQSNINKKSEPINFEIDITNRKLITIRVTKSEDGGYSYLILGNAYFMK